MEYTIAVGNELIILYITTGTEAEMLVIKDHSPDLHTFSRLLILVCCVSESRVWRPARYIGDSVEAFDEHDFLRGLGVFEKPAVFGVWFYCPSLPLMIHIHSLSGHQVII